MNNPVRNLPLILSPLMELEVPPVFKHSTWFHRKTWKSLIRGVWALIFTIMIVRKSWVRWQSLWKGWMYAGLWANCQTIFGKRQILLKWLHQQHGKALAVGDNITKALIKKTYQSKSELLTGRTILQKQKRHWSVQKKAYQILSRIMCLKRKQMGSMDFLLEGTKTFWSLANQVHIQLGEVLWGVRQGCSFHHSKQH